MGTRAALALLFVVALGASGLFWWLAGGEGSPRGAAEVSGPAGEEAPAVDRPPAALEPVEAIDPGSRGRSIVEKRPGLAQETQPVGSRAAAARVVRGQVLDPSGAPVAGAQVAGGPGGSAFLDLDIELPFDAGRVFAETDEEGRFELEDPPAGLMNFLVTASGFAPLRKERVALAPDQAELDPFVLRPGAILVGHVVDPAGSGVPGAEIVSLGERAQPFFGTFRKPLATTATDGSFRIDQLAPGAYRLVVRSEAHPDLIVEGLTERPGEVISGLLWRLMPGAEILGRVVDVPPADRGRLEVRATQAGSDGLAVVLRGRSAPVGADGSFRLRGLTPQTSYELVARRAADRPGFFGRSRSEKAQANAGDVGVVLRYQPEGVLTFQVLDASTNAPLTDFEVEAGVDWPQPLRDDDGRVQTFHPDGLVRFGGLRPASRDERVQLRVRAAGYDDVHRDNIALRMGQELDLGTIYLDPVPLLRVTVFNPDGVPVEGARVRLQKDAGDAFRVERRREITDDHSHDSLEIGEGRSARTDENGVAELSSYPGETCELIVRADGFAPFEKSNLRLPDARLAEETVKLTRGGRVIVSVFDPNGDPLPAAQVAHREPGAGIVPGQMLFGTPPDRAVTDAEGKVVFENLQPGVHGFRLREGNEGGVFFGSEAAIQIEGLDTGASDWSEIQVVEDGTAEISLTATPRGSLRGKVLESGQELAGASLSLQEKKGDAEADPFALTLPGFGGGGLQVKTDGRGGFEFADVKIGTYTLKVSHPTRRMADEFEVDILEGRNLLDLDLPVSIIEGRITDAEGRPLPGLRVRAERAQKDEGPTRQAIAIMITDDGDGTVVNEGGQPLGHTVYTDANGRYSLRGVMPEVELVVRAEGEGVQPGSSRKVRLEPDQLLSNVDLQLEAGGAIEVEVFLADGAPARFCMLSANYLEDRDVEPRNDFLQGGTTTLDGLKPGRWKISARRVGPSGNNAAPAEREVVVRPGETTPATLRFD